MSSLRSASLIAIALSAAPAAFAQESPTPIEISASDLAADIKAIEDQIAETRADAESYQAGLLQLLSQARLETLSLTKAILENRQAAQEGGAVVEIGVPSLAPDPERADQILADIQRQQGIISEAEAEAANTGGLIQGLALSRVETEKLTLAQLRATWFQAQYGVLLPVTAKGFEIETVSGSTPSPSETDEEEIVAASTAPDWADPDHPEIDYNTEIFAQFASEGFNFAGMWAILEDRAEVDDSPLVYAINLSEWESEGFMPSHPSLSLGCSEGKPGIIYDVDEFLMLDFTSNTVPVTFRINDEDAVSDRWRKITTGEGAGLFEANAQNMMRKLYDADTFFVRLTEENGKRHDGTFNLSGIQTAADKVANACGFTTLTLNADDYRSIQTMLNTGGFEAGTPDGQWGPGSRAAMKRYQASVGLPETGAPDRTTLDHMGFSG